MAIGRYCLAHGLMTLHLRTELGGQCLPAAFYRHWTGQDALFQGGPRVRRVGRWDTVGWGTWWELLARLAGGRAAVAALPDQGVAGEVDASFSSAYCIPSVVAVRAAAALLQGTALYLGAFSGELAAFDPAGMEDVQVTPPGLEALYRAVVAEVFFRERQVLLPVEVPALLQAGHPVDLGGLLAGIEAALGRGPLVLGGEDDLVVAAVAAVLREQGHEVEVVDPLDGMERLLGAIGGLG